MLEIVFGAFGLLIAIQLFHGFIDWLDRLSSKVPLRSPMKPPPRK